MKNLKYIDKPLLIATVILFIFGLIMILSASNVTAYMTQAVSPYYYLVRQGLILSAGLILFLISIKIDTKKMGVLAKLLMYVFIGLLACLLVYGKAKNQAVSWFDLGFFSLQPSEFLKVISIAWLAFYYDKHSKKLKTYKRVIYPIVLCIIPAGLIVAQPDLGTATIYAITVATMFFSVPMNKNIKRKLSLLTIGLLVVGGITLYKIGPKILAERQLERFDFLKPCDKILDTGNQVCNCYIAINNGGLTGVGLGKSTQKYLYLPEPYTDFIFAIIVEECGIIVGILLILFYVFIVLRILTIGKQSKTNRGALICYGVAIYLSLHIVVNLTGIMGLLPMTGVPLPFMSYGGSFTICLIAALSMVQRVSIENNLNKG